MSGNKKFSRADRRQQDNAQISRAIGEPLLDSRTINLPPLTRDEEILLFADFAKAQRVVRGAAGKKKLTRAKKNASQTMVNIRNELILRNLGLICSVAKMFIMVGEDLHDKVQDGVLKLLQCVDKYESAKGFRFATYLYRSLVFLYMQQRSAETDARNRRYTSLEDGEVEDHLDQQAAPEPTVDADLLIEFREVLAKNSAELTQVELKIIRATTGTNPKTISEIAIAIGLSSGRVKQIRNEAIEKLREVLCR